MDKVDGSDQEVKAVSKARFKVWKSDLDEHSIFREFIEKERNTLLKEYEFNVHPLEEVSIALRMTAMPIGDGELVEIDHLFQLEENIYRPLIDGPWAGDDARDVLQEAIKWWGQELSSIDDLVSKIGK